MIRTFDIAEEIVITWWLLKSLALPFEQTGLLLSIREKRSVSIPLVIVTDWPSITTFVQSVFRCEVLKCRVWFSYNM